MTKERLDAILDRLDALLAGTEDPDRRRQIREIQQLVVGVRSDHESAGEQGDDQGTDDPSARTDSEEQAGAADGESGPADED